MMPEYDFDHRKAKPNRFAGRISKERVVVVLDPEVSKVFYYPGISEYFASCIDHGYAREP